MFWAVPPEVKYKANWSLKVEPPNEGSSREAR
jgi:hypothetical protein